jgi:hypothetical protein
VAAKPSALLIYGWQLGGVSRVRARRKSMASPFKAPFASHAAALGRWSLLRVVLHVGCMPRRGRCVGCGAPTFSCRTTSHNHSWLLFLLRCLLFDGTRSVYGSHGSAGPSGYAPSETTTARAWPPNRWRRLFAGDTRMVLDVCGWKSKASHWSAVGIIARRRVGVFGSFCRSCCSPRCGVV